MVNRVGILIILLVKIMWSCAYENEDDLFGENPCEPELTTYSEVVEPIISSNCAIPSCHDGSNSAAPNWTIFDNVQAQAQDIKERTGNRTMPPSSSDKILTAAQIADIACWVDNGAQDN